MQGGPGGSEEGEEDLNWVISAKMYVIPMSVIHHDNQYIGHADNPLEMVKLPTKRLSRFSTLHLFYLVKKQIIDLRFQNPEKQALQKHHLRSHLRRERRMEFKHSRMNQKPHQTNLLILVKTMSPQIKHERKIRFTTITNIQIKQQHLYKCLRRNTNTIYLMGIPSTT